MTAEEKEYKEFKPEYNRGGATPRRKTTEKSPNWKGKCNVNGRQYEIAVWKNAKGMLSFHFETIEEADAMRSTKGDRRTKGRK